MSILSNSIFKIIKIIKVTKKIILVANKILSDLYLHHQTIIIN